MKADTVSSSLEKCLQLLGEVSALEFAEFFLESAREPFLILDPNLRVLWANCSSYRSFHLLPEDTLDKLIYDLGQGQWNISGLRTLLEEVVREKSSIHDFQIDIGTRKLLLNAHPIPTKKKHLQAILLVIEDVTSRELMKEERKLLLNKVNEYASDLEKAHKQCRSQDKELAVQKEALRVACEELDKRVQERTVELVDLNEMLEQEIAEHRETEAELKAYAAKLEWSNRELQDFAYVASHDLQEPLRKIQTFGDRLKAKYSDVMGDDGCDYLERMLGAAKRMQELINDLLTYSRVTTKAQPFVSVNLRDAAHQALSNLETRIEETAAQVDLGNLPTIEADPAQMVQLLQNLISNAFKFRRNDRPPLVKVYVKGPTEKRAERSPDALDDSQCQIYVEDNGIGFDEQYLDRLFMPFQRLHGRSQYEGTGIGLAICRKIAERHGGTITAKSTPGLGSTFTVTLPVKQKFPEGA